MSPFLKKKKLTPYLQNVRDAITPSPLSCEKVEEKPWRQLNFLLFHTKSIPGGDMKLID